MTTWRINRKHVETTSQHYIYCESFDDCLDEIAKFRKDRIIVIQEYVNDEWVIRCVKGAAKDTTTLIAKGATA